MEQLFFITWATHNSRYSQRMFRLKIECNPPILFNNEHEVFIIQLILELAKERKYDIQAINICKDHVHMLIKCNFYNIRLIMKYLKGRTAYEFVKKFGEMYEGDKKVWSRGYNYVRVQDIEAELAYFSYTKNNRNKHNLEPNPQLESVLSKIYDS